MPATTRTAMYARFAKNNDTYIGRYMRMMRPLETPLAYDFWTALWTISTAIGRSCFVDRPRAPVYLNQYLLLLAESGITRKSTSIGYAKRVIESYSMRYEQNITVFSGKASPEYLTYQLAKQTQDYGYAHTAIPVSELVTFFGRERYTMAMPGLLTDLYDAPETLRLPGTFRHGELNLRNVYITFLSASTPSWLYGAINPSVVEGGFTSRIIICNERLPKRRVAWPEDKNYGETPEDLAEYLGELVEFVQRRGEIPLTAKAKRKFVNWYNQRQLSAEPYASSFESREDDHVLRTAALISIAAGRGIIDCNDMGAAIHAVNYSKVAGRDVFGAGKHRDKFAYVVDRITARLIEAGKEGLTSTDVWAAIRSIAKSEDAQFALAIMHELGMVDKFKVQRGVGRPTIIWRGTAKLQAKNAQELINAAARGDD